jgi:hypothetical protein
MTPTQAQYQTTSLPSDLVTLLYNPVSLAYDNLQEETA